MFISTYEQSYLNINKSISQFKRIYKKNWKRSKKLNKLKGYETDFDDEILLFYQDNRRTKTILKMVKYWPANVFFCLKNNRRYKGRLVFNGYEQKSGTNCGESFSPVYSIRIVFSLAVNNTKIIKLDVKIYSFIHNLWRENL